MKAFRVIFTVLLICWMVLIFSLSHQSANISNQTSGSVIKVIADIIYPNFNNLDSAEQQEIIASMQFVVRKAAHFTIYAILGGLAFLSVITYSKLHLWLRTAISGGICLAYSISDEIHQLFISGRSGEFRDVCIDFAGSLLAILILLLLTRCKQFKKYI